jgi:hypothetical protein
MPIVNICTDINTKMVLYRSHKTGHAKFSHAAIDAIEKSCGFLPDGREVVISPVGGVYIKQPKKGDKEHCC